MRLALMRPSAPWLIGLVLSLLLAACGGGGGDGAGSTTPPPAAGQAQLAVAVIDSLGRSVASSTVIFGGGSPGKAGVASDSGWLRSAMRRLARVIGIARSIFRT